MPLKFALAFEVGWPIPVVFARFYPPGGGGLFSLPFFVIKFPQCAQGRGAPSTSLFRQSPKFPIKHSRLKTKSSTGFSPLFPAPTQEIDSNRHTDHTYANSTSSQPQDRGPRSALAPRICLSALRLRFHSRAPPLLACPAAAPRREAFRRRIFRARRRPFLCRCAVHALLPANRGDSDLRRDRRIARPGHHL